MKNLFEIGSESILHESKELKSLAGYLEREPFEKAVHLLCSCGKVLTCASGTSGVAAKKLAHSLCCIERPAFFLSPAEAVHGGLGGLSKGDAIVIVSRGGKTAELLPIIRAVKGRGASLIAVTENPESELAARADIILQLRIERETDKYNYMATSSFVATIGLFDALLVACMELTGYRREQFGSIHPGGAVGERLNSEEKQNG